MSTAARDDRAASGGDPGAARAAEDVAPSPPPSTSGSDGLPGLPLASGSGLPVFPLLPREELLSPEELAVKLQGFGQYGCVCPLTGQRVAPTKGCFLASRTARSPDSRPT